MEDMKLENLKVRMRGKLSNNGKTIGFTIDNTVDNNKENDDVFIKLIMGKETYELNQFHLHFACDGQGSEHTVDGTRFKGEVNTLLEKFSLTTQRSR